MSAGKKALLLGSGIAALGIAAEAISQSVTHRLAHLALDRFCPQSMSPAAARRISGCDRCEDFLAVLERHRLFLETQPGKILTVRSYDGTILRGHWIPCQNPKRTLIAMHGWRSGWSRDFGLIGEFLQKSGCNVLYAEQRAQHCSGGNHIGLGILEQHDCLAWANQIQSLKGQFPMYLAGISMGASTVLMASGLALPANVRGIIADCGYTCAYDIGKHILKNNLHLPLRFSRNQVERILRKTLHAGQENASTLTALEKNRLPVLLLHGTEDHFVPISMSYRNYETCRGPRELVVFPGADHGMSYYLDPIRYQKALLDFWKRFD